MYTSINYTVLFILWSYRSDTNSKLRSSRSTPRPNIEVIDINEVGNSMSSISSKSKIRRRRTKKASEKSSLDSSRFRTITDNNQADDDQPSLEPAISIFDQIENEKAKVGIQKSEYKVRADTLQPLGWPNNFECLKREIHNGEMRWKASHYCRWPTLIRKWSISISDSKYYSSP